MNNQNILGRGNENLSITDGRKQNIPQFITTNEQINTSFKMVYYLWISRLFIFLSSVSLIFFLSASLALFRLAPLVEVEPFLIINQSSSEDLVRTEPIELDMASKDLLLETFIKQYVILRNTIINDQREMDSRWLPGGMIHFLSSPMVFRNFREEKEKNKVQEENVQEVEIISLARQGGKKSKVWKVDFKTYVVRKYGRAEAGLKLEEHYWTASITANFYKERMFMGRRLINPLGFTVTRYSQTEVEVF